METRHFTGGFSKMATITKRGDTYRIRTSCDYHKLKKRAYAALGHIRIDRISPLDVQR